MLRPRPDGSPRAVGFGDPDDLSALSEAIGQRLADGVDGVVITQGTDTIEETAYLLDLTHTGQQPVVLTGAMRNATLADADGPANLLTAVQVAASPQARGLGTSHLLGAKVQFLTEMLVIEVTNPAMHRTPAPDLYDVPLLQFVPNSNE